MKMGDDEGLTCMHVVMWFQAQSASTEANLQDLLGSTASSSAPHAICQPLPQLYGIGADCLVALLLELSFDRIRTGREYSRIRKRSTLAVGGDGLGRGIDCGGDVPVWWSLCLCFCTATLTNMCSLFVFFLLKFGLGTRVD